jgi:hypothetical protein
MYYFEEKYASSVALKDQLILKIVYDKERFFVVFFGCSAQKLSHKFVI